MTKIVKQIILIITVGILLYLPLIVGKYYSLVQIFPAFEIILLYIYIKHGISTKKIVLMLCLGLVLAIVYDIPLVINILLIILGCKIYQIMEGHGFFINYNHNIVLTDYSRFVVFAFIELNFKYMSESLLYLHAFDYLLAFLQIINTICYYPLIYLFLDSVCLGSTKKHNNY